MSDYDYIVVAFLLSPGIPRSQVRRYVYDTLGTGLVTTRGLEVLETRNTVKTCYVRPGESDKGVQPVWSGGI